MWRPDGEEEEEEEEEDRGGDREPHMCVRGAQRKGVCVCVSVCVCVQAGISRTRKVEEEAERGGADGADGV